MSGGAKPSRATDHTSLSCTDVTPLAFNQPLRRRRQGGRATFSLHNDDIGTPPRTHVSLESCNPFSSFIICCISAVLPAERPSQTTTLSTASVMDMMNTFTHQAALTIGLLELDYAQSCAVEKESVDKEGALPANVEALWFPVLNLVPHSNTKIMARNSGEQLVEVCPSLRADLPNGFVHGLRKENCRDKNLQTAASEFRGHISKSNREIPQPNQISCL